MLVTVRTFLLYRVHVVYYLRKQLTSELLRRTRSVLTSPSGCSPLFDCGINLFHKLAITTFHCGLEAMSISAFRSVELIISRLRRGGHRLTWLLFGVTRDRGRFHPHTSRRDAVLAVSRATALLYHLIKSQLATYFLILL